MKNTAAVHFQAIRAVWAKGLIEGGSSWVLFLPVIKPCTDISTLQYKAVL